MKKIYLIIGALFFLTLVTAQLVGKIIPADFIIPEREEPIRYNGTITFKVDGKPFSCYLDEPNLDIDDDFEQECLSKYSGRITDVRDWTGREYKEIILDHTTYRSFDEDKLIKLKENHERMIGVGK